MSERSVPPLTYIEKADKTSLSGLKILLTKQTEILSALRDWFHETERIRQLIDEYVSLHGQMIERGVTYDLNRLRWIKAEGPNGPYKYADKADNMSSDAYEDFKALVEDLKVHGGRVTRQGYYMWLFSQGDRVGRKPSDQVKKTQGGMQK